MAMDLSLRGREKWVALGLIVLAVMPYLSAPVATLARLLAFAVLIFGAAIEIVTRTPAKAFRPLVIGLGFIVGIAAFEDGIYMLRVDPAAGVLEATWGSATLCFLIECLVLARTGRLRFRLSRMLAIMGFADASALMLGLNSNVVLFVLPFASCLRVGKDDAGKTPFGWIDRFQTWCIDLYRRAEGLPPATSLAFMEARRQRLIGKLTKLGSEHGTPERRYRRLLSTCYRHPDVRLAWQMAYAAAVKRNDSAALSNIIHRASKAGFDLSMREVTPIAVLEERFGSQWKEVLCPADLRELLMASDTGVGATLDRWQMTDPEFRRLDADLNPARLRAD